MGVQGLWQLLNPTGRPVSLQSLEGKILAVDVSIWLHQAVKGMRDRDGNPLPNAHLQVLFNRLCKLLYYRIKPVFVFDGGVPVLKKQTMAARREKKEFAELESDKATKNLVQNLMKSHAIKEVLKTDASNKTNSAGPKPSTSKAGKADLFELPPLPEEFKSVVEDSRRTEFTANERMLLEDVDLNQIDVESDAFNSLPAEMRHEVLTLLKDKKKRHTWNQILELPQETNDFSKFQMQKLMKQNKLSSHLAKLTKEMNDNRSGDITSFLGDDFYSDVIETRKIMSDDSAHSILIKGLGGKEQKDEMDRIRLELEQRKTKEKSEGNSGEIRNITVDEISEIKEIDFAAIEVDKSKLKDSENLLTDSDKVVHSYNTISSKAVQSERQDILKEIQQRMNDLEDRTSSGDNFEVEKNLNKKKRVVSDNDGSDNVEIHNIEDDLRKTGSSFIDSSNKVFQNNKSERQEIQGAQEKIDIKSQDSVKDLTATRLNILDELRQKVNVLNADVQLDSDIEEINNYAKEEKMQVDSENESEIKQTISENRKAIMKKQLSLDEEQITKKAKLSDVNNDKEKETFKTSAESISCSSESEDEGFIEVTVDLDKAHPDDLFPADIFEPVNSEKDDNKLEEQFRSPVQIDQDKVDIWPHEEISEVQEKITPMDFKREEMMSHDMDDKNEEDHIDLVEQFKNFTESEMRDYQENLDVESRDLQQEKGRQERLAASITDQMYTEAQELLELFGVPYIISPMEAEAQCAQLDLSDLTQGTITDDSDIWLFGGRRVYKNFFNQDKHVEFFSDISIKSQLSLGRDILIKLALLCGSDYTPGIQGVGPITAMEILTQFPADDLDGLRAFKKWWDAAQTQLNVPLETKIKTKLRKLEVPEGFPNEVVVAAYMNPEIDDSQEKFSWGSPELDLIRIFTEQKIGWSKEKCDETLVPMMKQFNLKQKQTRINDFFQPENFLKPKNVKSKRLQQALGIMQGQGDTVSEPVGLSDNLINQSSGLLSMAGVSQTKTRQITVGKGRARGKGKGKGKGKSSVGQRSKVVISNEVNLSESSSESSGDELIANLDYESIMGENEPVIKPASFTSSKSDTKNNSRVSKQNNLKPTKQKSTKAAPKNIKTNIETAGASLSTENIPSTNDNPGSNKGRRTKPNIRIGKAGHATEEFSLDLPKAKEPITGFLEDEVKTFDKVKKMKPKTQILQSSEVKKEKLDKGKKLVKGNKTAKKSKPEVSIETPTLDQIRTSDNPVINKEEKTNVVDTLLNRRTRSCKTGSVNKVMVVSDSDSD